VEILDFLSSITQHVEGVGWICTFATFEIQKNGDERWGAPPPKTEDDRLRTGNKMLLGDIKSNDGKMEQSFINFKIQNPDWTPIDPAGERYIARIHQQSIRDKKDKSYHTTKFAADGGEFRPDPHANLGIADVYSSDGEENSSTEASPAVRARETKHPDKAIMYVSRILERSVVPTNAAAAAATQHLVKEADALQAGVGVFDLLNQVNICLFPKFSYESAS